MTFSLQDTPVLGNHKHDSARSQCCLKMLPRSPGSHGVEHQELL